MDTVELTPAFVQETLRVFAGLEIDAAEAEKLLPWIKANRDAMAAVEPFDLCEVRSSLGFDPTGPYR
ncbi:MAG TPA: hypothetical protein VII06_28575 [Chloroflexota bacterium]|jgi:hypothetical protein